MTEHVFPPQERFCFGIIVFSCLSSTYACLRFLLIYFARETEGFCQNSLGNNERFQKYLG